MLKMSIKLRLSLSFLFLVSLAALLGTFAYVQLDMVAGRLKGLAERQIPSLSILGGLNGDIDDARFAADDVIRAPSPDELESAARGLSDAVDTIESDLSVYSRLATGAKEKEHLEKLKASWGSYKDYLEQIVALAKKEQMAEAFDLQKGKAQTAFKSVSDAVGETLDNTTNDGAEMAAQGKERARAATASVLIAIGCVIVLSLVLAYFVIRSILDPIGRLVGAVSKVTAGRVEDVVPGTDRTDELGPLARALDGWRSGLIEARERQARELEQTEKAKQDARAAAVEAMVSEFNQSVGGLLDQLAGAAVEMEATAQSLTATAAQTQNQAAAAGEATNQAASGVQTAASAAEELSASISEIGQQVTQSSRISQSASQEASRSNDTIQGLSESAGRIGQVIGLITDIANQTNLLALNATIEAARAGEAGKGFAVVASEVKSLASQTARATEEIRQQIGEVQSATHEAVEATTAIVARINEINEIASGIAAAVEEQSASTADIARNVQQAAISSQSVSENIEEVSRAASGTGASAGQVLASAQGLAHDSVKLKEAVDQFIEKLRASA